MFSKLLLSIFSFFNIVFGMRIAALLPQLANLVFIAVTSSKFTLFLPTTRVYTRIYVKVNLQLKVTVSTPPSP